MSKMRMIDTRFWLDNYVSELDPSEKLLFLYFITNPFTNICGIYEITTKQIALDTGFDKEMIIKMLSRFAADEKIYYLDGWVCVKNFAKHQKTSGNIEIGIKNGLKQVPPQILAKIKEKTIHTPHTPPTQGGHSPKLELESESELELESELEDGGLSPQVVNEINRVGTDTAPCTKEDDGVNKVFALFYKINPGINFGNTTQRKAADWLIGKFGEVDALAYVAAAISAQGQPYAPTITTPYQLKEKLGELKIFYDKSKSKQIVSV